MLYTYEELPIGFGFLGGMLFSINFISDFDYKVVIKKNLSFLFYAVFRYLAATQCISVFKYIADLSSFTHLA